jgi:hypothetical protein
MKQCGQSRLGDWWWNRTPCVIKSFVASTSMIVNYYQPQGNIMDLIFGMRYCMYMKQWARDLLKGWWWHID